MNPQKESQLVRYYADNHLFVTGNLYQLFDNYTHKKIYQCSASSDIDASRKCCAFLRYGEES